MVDSWRGPGPSRKGRGGVKTVGGRLRETREQLVWTQAQLAEWSGVSLAAVKRIEGDQAEGGPRPTTVQKLAEALGVNSRWLMHGTPPKWAGTRGAESQERTKGGTA